MTAPPGREVYGLRVHGLDAIELLPPVTSGAELPELTVGQDPGPAPAERPERKVLPLPDGRVLVLDRAAATAVFHGPTLSDDLLAHPYLAAAAREWNRWAGRDTFHGGVFAHAGRAWIVCGPREAGKSSLMAGLAAAGVPVLADDLAVVQDGQVFAGPRSIDLRGPVPAVGGDLPDARLGTRRRMTLPPVPPRMPLGGWFFLHWGGQLATTPVPAARLLARLIRARSRPHQPSDPLAVLSLAGTPGWDLLRPRDWALLPATIEHLLCAAASAPAVLGSATAPDPNTPARGTTPDHGITPTCRTTPTDRSTRPIPARTR